MKHLLRYAMIFILTLGAMGTYVCYEGAIPALAAEQEALEMEVTYGYGNAVKSEHYLPVRVELSNSASDVFEGTVGIQVTESSFEVYDYSFPVIIKPETELQEIYYIPLGVKNDQLYVTLKSAEGDTVLSKRVKLNIAVDVAELFVGVLTDEPEKLDYLNGVMIYDSMIRTRTLPMDAENFPEDPMGLDMIDVLLVSSYKINRLNHSQTEALLEWVADGGTLMMGTGSRIADNLGSLGSRLLMMPYPEAVDTEVEMGAEYAMNAPGDSLISFPYVDISVKNGSEIMSSNELVLMTRVPEGRGNIILAGYDFADIREFGEQYPSYVGKIFTAALGERKLVETSQSDYYGYSNQYWRTQSIVGSGDADRLPNVALYSVVILAYVLLIGPALYFFLKNRDKQGLYVAGVLAAAFLASGIIYFMGAGTRFTDRFFNYVTIKEETDDQVRDTTYVGVQAPFNKPYSVSFAPEYKVRPMTRSRLYDNVPMPKLGDQAESKVEILAGADETLVNMKDVKSFDLRMFELTKTETPGEQSGLTADLSIYDGELEGTITNGLEEAVRDVTLLFYGKIVKAGDLEPGASVDVSGLEIISYPLSYSYTAAQIATGMDEYEQADVSDPGYVTARKRSGILDFYIGRVFHGYSGGSWMVYFKDREPEQDEFLAENGYDNSGMTAYAMELDVKNERNGQVIRSVHRTSPKALSGSYIEEYNSMIGPDALVLEYALGSDIQVEKMLVEQVSERFNDAEKYPYLTIFNGSMSFYNYETDSYDLMDLKQQEFGREQLSPYLSPDNKLRVRYSMDTSGGISWDVVLPMLTVAGRER